MAKRIAHIVLSTWLAIILLFGTTPKEFVHLFANHKDTVHRVHEGYAFEKEHHHCHFLGFELMPFAHDYQIPRIGYIPTEYILTEDALKVHFIQRTIVLTALRGPPCFS